MDISPLLTPPLRIEAVAHVLEGVGEEGRRGIVHELSPHLFPLLWNAAAQAEPCTLEDLVPSEHTGSVIHDGQNSMSLFSRFQKRMVRRASPSPQGTTSDTPASPSEEQVWGYNEQPFLPFTGPGYFVARIATAADGVSDCGVVFDYTRIPADAPPGFPPVIPNTARLGRFVYANMLDGVRRVAPGVLIGRAYRRREPLDVWFVLLRHRL